MRKWLESLSLPHREFDPDQPECMDDPSLQTEDLSEDLDNLVVLNRYFGGITATRRAITVMGDHPCPIILDCPCGAGDLTHELGRLLPGCKVLVAADLHPATLLEAQRRQNSGIIKWIRADVRALPFADATFDLVSCQLSLHHLSHEDALQALSELARVCRGTVWVSDLNRSIWGYLGVWLLTRFWLRHPMTQRDACLSFKRAFTKHELLELARQAGWTMPNYERLPWHRHAIWCKRD